MRPDLDADIRVVRSLRRIIHALERTKLFYSTSRLRVRQRGGIGLLGSAPVLRITKGSKVNSGVVSRKTRPIMCMVASNAVVRLAG